MTQLNKRHSRVDWSTENKNFQHLDGVEGKYQVYEIELHMLAVSAQMKHAIHCSNEKKRKNYEEYSFTGDTMMCI